MWKRGEHIKSIQVTLHSPMYPALPFFVLFPMSQIALTSASLNPRSLHRMTILDPSSFMMSSGVVPSGYSLSSAFWTSSRTKCVAFEYSSSLTLYG